MRNGTVYLIANVSIVSLNRIFFSILYDVEAYEGNLLHNSRLYSSNLLENPKTQKFLEKYGNDTKPHYTSYALLI